MQICSQYKRASLVLHLVVLCHALLLLPEKWEDGIILARSRNLIACFYLLCCRSIITVRWTCGCTGLNSAMPTRHSQVRFRTKPTAVQADLLNTSWGPQIRWHKQTYRCMSFSGNQRQKTMWMSEKS